MIDAHWIFLVFGFVCFAAMILGVAVRFFIALFLRFFDDLSPSFKIIGLAFY